MDLKDNLTIEFRQHDWIEGFAALLADDQPDFTKPAFCVLNLGGLLSLVKMGHAAPEDLPYIIAESMMHEIIHCLEQWAGVEFNEDRVEQLLAQYQASIEAKRTA